MREEPDSLKTPEIDQKEFPGSRESDEQRRIDQIANEMAEKGNRTEHKYDENLKIPATGPGGIS
ncbi:MAG TPA: hypothetical protein DGA22_13420 [Acidobacterium sp.]|uniref:Uncharacterized protein n=2 Tax=Acidobacteriaceae TaxID=204434 RepID=C1F501_ACIC5|nr:hypothetical protein ACP_3087 [Acidobacterium capsulatum ATCC 51196]HCT61858.1 hypothetical protein [Acidobacterium sp.]